jgi:hypothetical protein
MFKHALAALVLLCAAARAEATDFLGNWQNTSPQQSGLTHVAISPNGGNRVDVRAYGDCHPIECDWGMVQGKVFSSDPKSDSIDLVVATFHFGFAHRQITFRKDAAGKLKFEMLTEFADNSERHDFAVSGSLRQTAWAGPITQIWQEQPGLATGWGGGPRNGVAPPPVETCKAFDTRAARAVLENGMWSVKAGGRTLVEAGHDQKAAEIAETVLRHYKFDRRCTVGGPWKAYWKSGEDYPSEKIGGVACVKFNPTTVHLVRIGQDWTIVDGVTSVAAFAANKPKAEATLGLIRSHQLSAQCSVRQPDPVMMFWLAN